MSDIPGPERGFFCITIVNIILKIALVLFILLCENNYEYDKCLLKSEVYKCKTIHSGLLLIAVLKSIWLQLVINILVLYIIARYTLGGKLCDILNWPLMILLFCCVLY